MTLEHFLTLCFFFSGVTVLFAICDLNPELDRLSDLTSDLDRLSREIGLAEKEHLAELENQDKYNAFNIGSVQWRLTHLKDHGCPDPFFQLQCGLSLRCLPDYLVCDGSKDCPLGEDEQDCDISAYLQPGLVIDGTTLFDECSPIRMTRYACRVAYIDTEYQRPTVVLDCWLELPVDGGGSHYVNYPYRGVWLYSSRTIYLESSSGTGVDYFTQLQPSVNTDVVMKEYSFRQQSGELCGLVILSSRTDDRAFPWPDMY